jgi:serine acetyltransferase
MQLNSLLTGADFLPQSDIGAGLLIPTPCGVVLGGKAGRNLTVLALSGVGSVDRDRDIGAGPGLPILGDDVVLNHFSGLLGAIRIGDRVVVEAGILVFKDAADDSELVRATELHCGPSAAARSFVRDTSERCHHDRWSETRADFAHDITRFAAELPSGRRGFAKKLSIVLGNQLLAILVYRISHWLLLNGHRRLACLLSGLNVLVTKLTIPPGSCIGGGLLIPHLAGIVFCGRAGKDLTLVANSLCTAHLDALTASDAASPRLGDGVTINAHSGIIGPVSIGDHVRLAPNVQVTQDLTDDIQAFSPMARYVERKRASAGTASKPNTPAAPFEHDLPPDRPWQKTLRHLRRDRARLRPPPDDQEGIAPAFISRFPAFVCVLLYRLSHYFHAVGRRRPARWFWLLNAYLTGADISPSSQIGGGLLIPYPAGIAFHGRAGSSLTLMAMTGVGPPIGLDGRLCTLAEAPLLGDSVYLAHHTGAYGAITVASGVRVLPGCVINAAVEDAATLIPCPLRLRRIAAGRTGG